MYRINKIFLLLIIQSLVLMSCNLTIGGGGNGDGNGDTNNGPLPPFQITSISNNSGSGIVLTFNEELKEGQTIDTSKIKLNAGPTAQTAGLAIVFSSISLLPAYWIDGKDLHLTMSTAHTAWNSNANMRIFRIEDANVIQGKTYGGNKASAEFLNTTTVSYVNPKPIAVYTPAGTTIYIEFDEPVTAETFANTMYAIKSDANATPTTGKTPTAHSVIAAGAFTTALTTKFPALIAAKAGYVLSVTVPAITAGHKISVEVKGSTAGPVKDRATTPTFNDAKVFPVQTVQ